MSKKKRQGKRRKRSSRAAGTSTGFQILTTIVVGSGNTISDTTPLVCIPGACVVWLVRNQDIVAHDVSIDPADFKRKDNNKREHPFAKGGVLSVSVDPDDTGLIVATIKKGAKNAGYKYS